MNATLHYLHTEDQTLLNLEIYRDLDQRIKALTKEKDKIGKSLKEGYFANHDEYVHDGRLLATYYTSTVVRLDQSALKTAMPKIYEQFQTIGEQRTFLLK